MTNLNTTNEAIQTTLFEMVETAEKETYEKLLNVRPEHFNTVLFKVSELPLYINGVDHSNAVNSETNEVEATEDYINFADYKALINQTNGSQISIVTTKYHVVDNTEVLEHFENMLKEQNVKFEYGFAVTARNGRKTIMEIILPEMVIDLGNGDTQEMRLYIQNSFDGGNSIKLDMGFFRHLCSNMALMSGTAEVQYKPSHIGNATDRIKTQFNFYLTEKFNEAKGFIDSLKNHEFSSPMVIEELLNKEDNTVVSDRDRTKVLNVWSDYYQGTFGCSFWGVYNAYTHHITHNLNISENGKMSKLVALSKLFENLIKDDLKRTNLVPETV
jgi:hypothetical protein